MPANDRYTLVSQDCHAGAPWHVYRNYLDPKYREDYDRFVTDLGADPANMAPSQQELRAVVPSTLPSFHSEERRQEYLQTMGKTAGHLGNWDPDIRTKELDREGIAGEVIFVDGSQRNHPPFVSGPFGIKGAPPSYEQLRAGARAHNRWLAELCQTNPGRHAGVAMVVMDDVENAVEEVRWARKNGLFGGILLPALKLTTSGPESFWHHPRYEPVWSVCEELDMVLNTHASGTGVDHGADLSWVGSQVSANEVTWTTFRPFPMLLWSGVFERHPRLKFAFTESGGMQVLWIKHYLDYVAGYRRADEVKKVLSMKPSEYWARQCYVGASAHSGRHDIDFRQEIGVKNILWGSDYPHPEGTWPVSINRTKELFAGVPVDETRLMLGENAARVYGFDMDKMQKLASKIGPKISEIGGAANAGAKSAGR